MYKEVKERPQGYMKTITHTVLICDGCGRRIIWARPHSKGHFCEDCFTALKKAEKENKILKGGN